MSKIGGQKGFKLQRMAFAVILQIQSYAGKVVQITTNEELFREENDLWKLIFELKEKQPELIHIW